MRGTKKATKCGPPRSFAANSSYRLATRGESERAEIRLPPWSVQARAAETIRAATVVREKAQCRLTTLNRLPAALLRQVFGETEDSETEEAC